VIIRQYKFVEALYTFTYELAVEMSFDKLPEELVVKIFRCLIDHRDKDGKDIYDLIYYHGDPPKFRECPEMSNLRLTCKRFLYIVNYKLLTISDCQYPRLPLPRGSWACPSANELECMEQIKKIVSFKYVKCRYVYLIGIDLTTSQIIQYIRDEQANLKAITELEVYSCKFDLIVLNKIISTLSSLRRLRFVDNRLVSKREPEIEEIARRTLAHITIEGFEDYGNLPEYILNYLPAREIVIDCLQDDFVLTEEQLDSSLNLSWLRRYLARHYAIINRCCFTIETDTYDCHGDFIDHNTDHVCHIVASLGYSITKIEGVSAHMFSIMKTPKNKDNIY